MTAQLTTEQLAQAAYAYVIRCGEAHPAAPKNERIENAIAAYDGNEPSEDEIFCAYRAAFEAKKPSKAFCKYVETIPVSDLG